MTARLRTNVTYFVLIVATLLLRISVYEGVGFEGRGLDHYFTFVAQIVCFTLVPVTMYFALRKKGDVPPLPLCSTKASCFSAVVSVSGWNQWV